MTTKTTTTTKRFIKAKSEKALERKMLENNIMFGASFDYTDISKSGKFWFAWFEIDWAVVMRRQLLKARK